ncbi:MAG TPA: hypothetical protein VEB22_14610 [Phycisphaerales bacterium]|nr:hypothetical protein [Phycisphaerales bacterium]
MTSRPFRRFTTSSPLREIAPPTLLALLTPHAEFLGRHHVALPGDPARLDYDAVAAAILQPRTDTPAALIDALWHIHEMATPQAMDGLLDEAHRAAIRLDADDLYSPADIAAQVWLAAPDLLRRKHAEQAVLRRKTFESFPAQLRAGAARTFSAPGEAALARLEEEVARWFVERRLGAGTRVFLFDHEHEMMLVVRHGGPYRREGSLDKGEPGSVHFRPMAFAVAVFDRRTLELRINSAGKREKQMLREAIGRHVFGDAHFFSAETSKYTLEPLRGGRRSLVCADVPGIRLVRLLELRMFLGGSFGRTRIEQADDVMLALEEDRESIPEDALLTAAKFEVYFADSGKPRPVTIRHGNVAQYARDGDADLVEVFLRRRGFVQGVSHAALACA